MANGIQCICCNAATRELSIADNFLGENLRYCPCCQHVQIASIPTSAAIKAYYQGVYSQRREHFVGEAYARLMKKRASAQIALISKTLSLSGRRVCDVGCGYGYLLEALKEHTTHIWGYEYDPATVESCRRRGLCVDLVPSEKALLNVKEADLVILSHCLEHFVCPGDTLQALAQKSSAIFVEVPAYDYNSPEQFVDQEGHINFFNAESLRLFLTRHGFRILSFVSCGPSIEFFYSPGWRLAKRICQRVTGDYYVNRYRTFSAHGVWLRALVEKEVGS